ncbi:MAG: phytanoyl-CoA dioxygenase family protein [Planctomycetaceae bacterium]
MFTDQHLKTFHETGHVTVPGVLTADQLAAACHDVETWSSEFMAALSTESRRWYLENNGNSSMLRKLDNPAFHRPFFRSLAGEPKLIEMVERLTGPGVSVFFSQVFCKPPEVGGPKPVHQDNFYFGPDNLDATLTVWIALDDANVENGCLFYADGSHTGPVVNHEAPVDEPFNLQIAAQQIGRYPMTAAPVPAGGISFHHGNTWHQSSANTSLRARRAVVFHYLRNDATLVNPALQYDLSVVVKVTD